MGKWEGNNGYTASAGNQPINDGSLSNVGVPHN